MYCLYRVVILVLMMLIIIPLLTVNELDTSEAIAVQIIGTLAALNYTDTSGQQLYQVSEQYLGVWCVIYDLFFNRVGWNWLYVQCSTNCPFY